MTDYYGEQEAQRLPDVEWIPDVTGAGFVIFSKDSGLKTSPERDAVVACGARVFLLPDAQAPARHMIERYVANRFRIARRARRPGPYIFMVRPDRLERVDRRVG
jgi:hypothetical protein